ncbi:MAG: gamma-glutamylcyclotransferase [Aquificae bacterium]|nr:gamma-glutamylcyclotransferase [Aquificota bacterium]
MKHIVFVYGTLKKGFCNHYYLRKARFLGSGRTKEKYKMTVSDIPFVSKKEKISYIYGGIYEIDEETLKNLDILEEHPSFYKREKIKVLLNNKKEIEAWIYFNEVLEGKILIKDGIFRKKLKN